MIHLHIYAVDHDSAIEIGKFLLKEHFCIDCKIEKNERIDSEGLKTLYEVNGISKLLLFQKIEEKMRSQFGGRYTEMFALPVVLMNWKRSNQIALEVEKV